MPKPVVISFVRRLDAKTLSIAESGAPSSSWIQVAVVGDYESPVYGCFSITKADLRQMLDNFTSGKYPVPPTELCMDYDHLSMSPGSPGDGKAAGWIKELELRSKNKELWAKVEWTSAGAEAITASEYRFVSPTFSKSFKTNAGEDIGCTLLGAAVTNQPFLQGMAPLSIAASRQLGTRPVVIALTEFSFYERCNRLQESLADRLGCDSWCCYVQDVYDDYVVYRYDSRLYRLDYTIAEDGTVTFDAMPQEVTVQYAPLGLSRPAQETTMPTITLKNTQGQDVQIDEAALEALPFVKELRAKLPPADAKVVKASEFDALQGQVTTLAADNTKLKADHAALVEAAANRDAAAAFDALVTARKAVPAQKDALVSLYLSNKTLFDSFAATAVEIGPEVLKEHGSGGAAKDETDPTAAIEAEADRLMASDAKLTRADAITLAVKKNSGQYDAHAAAVTVKV